MVDDLFKKQISEKFSNCVIIIDEVHNIKEGGKKDGKIVLIALKFILKHTRNLRLILLSATPMFNEAPEIIDLINLLRLNDNRALLKKKEIFNRKGNFKSSGSIKLLEKA